MTNIGIQDIPAKWIGLSNNNMLSEGISILFLETETRAPSIGALLFTGADTHIFY
jgi:hypothetical protein